jgi:hypothetical protein
MEVGIEGPALALHAALAAAPAAPAAKPMGWRDHVEQRMRQWRQSFVNRSGDQLALDDMMDARSLEDLIDYVCDEWSEPVAAPAAEPRIIAARYRNGTGAWTYTDRDIGSIEADGWREVVYLCDANAGPAAEPVGWVPVTDRLPKSGQTVLACYTNRAGNVRCIRAEWVAAKSVEANSDNSDIGVYDEATDTFYDPEGWYERIDNWDDYSAVLVCEGEVTHWMPLPAEPGAAPAAKSPEPPPLTKQQIAALTTALYHFGKDERMACLWPLVRIDAGAPHA